MVHGYRFRPRPLLFSYHFTPRSTSRPLATLLPQYTLLKTSQAAGASSYVPYWQLQTMEPAVSTVLGSQWIATPTPVCWIQEEEEPDVKRHRTDCASFSGRQPAFPPAAPAPGLFSRLSADLALQILACTSAADLTAISQTSRFFQQVAADNELWRILFLDR